ncbi:MAG: transcriptional repressor [Sphaerochaeta sp.]|jgi:Fur family peroxide stress response transcriptional regulator|nr:transcriptional repressor [Sphaerochaeta sp.]MCH3919305.1 transcriptional repressor [Sphaerochaeta sp.]
MITEKRQTIQKELVLEAVLASDDHPNADEVYQRVARKHPSISRSTVYRNLHNLVDEKKIRAVRVTDGPEHFDRTLSSHYHIQCTVCGRVSDLCVTSGESLETIVDASGYLVEGKDVIYRGVCPDCQHKFHHCEGV